MQRRPRWTCAPAASVTAPGMASFASGGTWVLGGLTWVGDRSGVGTVTASDLAVVLSNFGSVCPN